MPYANKRTIRISSSIIGGKRLGLESDAATVDELVDELANYDHPEYGKQVVDFKIHSMQMIHNTCAAGKTVKLGDILPETGTLAITITPADNKNG